MSQTAHAFMPPTADFDEEFEKELSRPRKEIDQMGLNCELEVVLFSLHRLNAVPFLIPGTGVAMSYHTL